MKGGRRPLPTPAALSRRGHPGEGHVGLARSEGKSTDARPGGAGAMRCGAVQRWSVLAHASVAVMAAWHACNSTRACMHVCMHDQCQCAPFCCSDPHRANLVRRVVVILDGRQQAPRAAQNRLLRGHQLRDGRNQGPLRRRCLGAAIRAPRGLHARCSGPAAQVRAGRGGGAAGHRWKHLGLGILRPVRDSGSLGPSMGAARHSTVRSMLSDSRCTNALHPLLATRLTASLLPTSHPVTSCCALPGRPMPSAHHQSATPRPGHLAPTKSTPFCMLDTSSVRIAASPSASRSFIGGSGMNCSTPRRPSSSLHRCVCARACVRACVCVCVCERSIT